MSRATERVFVDTATAPMRAHANQEMTNSGELSRCTRTRSPICTPRECNAPASDSTAAPNCAYEYVAGDPSKGSHTMNGLFPYVATRDANTEGTSRPSTIAHLPASIRSRKSLMSMIPPVRCPPVTVNAQKRRAAPQIARNQNTGTASATLTRWQTRSLDSLNEKTTSWWATGDLLVRCCTTRPMTAT